MQSPHFCILMEEKEGSLIVYDSTLMDIFKITKSLSNTQVKIRCMHKRKEGTNAVLWKVNKERYIVVDRNNNHKFQTQREIIRDIDMYFNVSAKDGSIRSLDGPIVKAPRNIKLRMDILNYENKAMILGAPIVSTHVDTEGNEVIATEAVPKKSGGDVNIPNYVTHIDNGTFSKHTYGSIYTGKGTKTIANGAFYEITANSLKVGSKLKHICKHTFINCNIAHMNLGGTIEEIESEALKGCTIEYLILSPKLTKLGTLAFYNTTINSLDLRRTKLEEIRRDELRGINGIGIEIKLPSGLKYIDIGCLPDLRLVSKISFPRCVETVVADKGNHDYLHFILSKLDCGIYDIEF